MRFFIIICISIFLCSCAGPYRGADILGADEFVMDSYRIREGKPAILEMQGNRIEELDCSWMDEYPDAIAEDDTLSVVLYHPQRTDLVAAVQTINHHAGYPVRQGSIEMPELSPIEVTGLHPERARSKILKAYNMRDLEVFVDYRVRASNRVELGGLVGVSCMPVNGKLRLYDVLAQARIPPQANLFASYIIREGKQLPIDFYRLLKEGDLSQNIVMRGGDKIYIADATAATVLVMGEVGAVCSLPVINGFIPLRQALAEARGITFTGDRSCIQVIRGGVITPKIFKLDWEHIIRLPNESLLLMPGDIVHVAATPIAEWNRFISQILPSVTPLIPSIAPLVVPTPVPVTGVGATSSCAP